MDPILHNYEISPFSEKVRRILAFKRMDWVSVRAPAVMPKPDLVALTGGYRKIPVLQLGCHVYCDTALIARVLERLQPSPTIYPTPAADIFAEWADTSLFESIVALTMRPTRLDEVVRLLLPDELSKIVEDRTAMRADARRQGPPREASKASLAVSLDRLDRMLEATRQFLFSSAPCIADFSTYHGLWLLEKLAPEPLATAPNVRAWMQRMAQIAGGAARSISSEDAIQICRESADTSLDDVSFDETAGFERGQRVQVRATDYGRDPVEGELVMLMQNEMAVRRNDPRARVVVVHFPRTGFEVRPA